MMLRLENETTVRMMKLMLEKLNYDQNDEVKVRKMKLQLE